VKQTISALTFELQALLDYLNETGLALYVNSILYSAERVTWAPWQPGVGLIANQRQHPRISDYRGWIEAGMYSAMLSDGALLQVTYEFDDGEVSKHRLAFVPSPFAMDPELLKIEAAVDVLDVYLAGDTSEVSMVSTVRFDFDQAAATEEHPHSHLTFNSTSCRIPCAAPLRLGHFVEFVYRNFYPEAWGA